MLEKYAEPCPGGLVRSALDHARILEDHDFQDYKIGQASDVFMAVAAYQQLAEQTDARFILASPRQVASAPEQLNHLLVWVIYYGPALVIRSVYPYLLIRLKKSESAYEMLKSLGLRRRGVTVISCPSCARQQFDVIPQCKKLKSASNILMSR